MAQKWTDVSNATNSNRLSSVASAATQLSDGTLVWIDYDATNWLLRYSSDHTSVNAIATLTSVGWAFGSGSCFGNIVRDSSDNLYIVGHDNGGLGIRVQGFTKGAGYSWTQQTSIQTNLDASSFGLNSVYGVWCNTGGGTGSHGHIMAIGGSSSPNTDYWIIDAGIALAGSGTLTTAGSQNPTFLGGSGGAMSAQLSDLSTDGFGATSGLGVTQQNTAYNLGAWSVTSAGALSTNTSLGTFLLNNGGTAYYRIRVIRYAANKWAVASGNSNGNGNILIATYSSTAQITSGVDSASPTNMPLMGNAVDGTNTPTWAAFRDPATTNRIWVITWQPTTGVVWATSCDVGSGVTWATAATSQDTFTVSSSTSGFQAIKEPVGSIVDWMTYVNVSSGGTYALYGDNTSFNTAPTCALSTPADLLPVATPPALTASITDPDSGQTDTVTFQVSTDSTFATGVTTLTTSLSTPTSSSAATVSPSNNLTPGQNFWRAHAVDSASTDSGWTAARSFILDPVC